MARKRKHYSVKEEKGSYYGKGQGQFANLPQEVEMSEFPKVYGNLEHIYPDSQPEIDMDLRDAFTKVSKNSSDSMY